MAKLQDEVRTLNAELLKVRTKGKELEMEVAATKTAGVPGDWRERVLEEEREKKLNEARNWRSAAVGFGGLVFGGVHDQYFCFREDVVGLLMTSQHDFYVFAGIIPNIILWRSIKNDFSALLQRPSAAKKSQTTADRKTPSASPKRGRRTTRDLSSEDDAAGDAMEEPRARTPVPTPMKTSQHDDILRDMLPAGAYEQHLRSKESAKSKESGGTIVGTIILQEDRGAKALLLQEDTDMQEPGFPDPADVPGPGDEERPTTNGAGPPALSGHDAYKAAKSKSKDSAKSLDGAGVEEGPEKDSAKSLDAGTAIKPAGRFGVFDPLDDSATGSEDHDRIVLVGQPGTVTNVDLRTEEETELLPSFDPASGGKKTTGGENPVAQKKSLLHVSSHSDIMDIRDSSQVASSAFGLSGSSSSGADTADSHFRKRPDKIPGVDTKLVATRDVSSPQKGPSRPSHHVPEENLLYVVRGNDHEKYLLPLLVWEQCMELVDRMEPVGLGRV